MTTGMHPTVGRAVHYTTLENPIVTLPAIVVKVHSDTCVDLVIFGVDIDVPAVIRTSVNEEVSLPSGATEQPGTWRWPVIS